MKITELIGTLGAFLAEIGDAEVCVCVGEGEIVAIHKTVQGLNVELPDGEKGNRLVLHGPWPSSS